LITRIDTSHSMIAERVVIRPGHGVDIEITITLSVDSTPRGLA